MFDKVTLDETNGVITCLAFITQPTAACPLCLEVATRIHSDYQRKLADLPWAGTPVQLWLQVRRFFCQNAECPRRIFSERLPTVAAPWGRRTRRLAEAQQAIGLAAGGSSGSKLCAALDMEAGIDLLLDLIRDTPSSPPSTVRVLGVDDWAMRKGQTYGTILIDLEQGAIVDLLPDRTAESLARWLRAHPGVEIISRDRAGAYAEGARLGAPAAIQVAERWHLLKNLTETVYKALQAQQAAIEASLAQAQSADKAQDLVPAVPLPLPTPTPAVQPSAADLARQQRVQETHRLHDQGWTAKAIAQQLGICPKTVGRYLNRELPLAPLRRTQRVQLLDPYKPYLLERWNAGCHNAATLWREICRQGFAGGLTIVRDFVRHLRQASGLPQRVRTAAGEPVRTDPSQRPPTLRTLAHLLTSPPAKRDAQEQASLARLEMVDSKLQTLVELAQAFATMLRQRQANLLDAWLDKADTSRVPALRSFAAGLRQDYAAVRTSLSLPWSNGPTEGHINRLKTLKRQMYGRAKLDLLRQRLLAA